MESEMDYGDEPQWIDKRAGCVFLLQMQEISKSCGPTESGGRCRCRAAAKWVWLAPIAVGLLLAIWVGAGHAPDPAMGGAAEDGAPRVVHVDPDRAAGLLAKGGVVVLDIRTAAEYASGHVAGATNIDYHARDFADRLAQLDRTETYLVHCASGRRSTEALATFEQLDFKSVVHLDGGLKAWRSAGKLVE
jgi:rhodanese-related sulfurtransferase